MKRCSIIFVILSILTVLYFTGCTPMTETDSKDVNQETKPTVVNPSENEPAETKPINLIVGCYIEDFDTLDTSVWTCGGDTKAIPTFAKIGDYELSGTSTIKMPCNEGRFITNGKYDGAGVDSYLQRTVYLLKDATVTFTFYPNADYNNGNARTELAFYIDNEEKGTWNGIGMPQTVSFVLPKGEHTLKWISRYTVANSYFPNSDMAFYLDKVSIASDEVKNVKIFLQGMQTVVAGECLTFTAKAYREDGSEIVGKDVTQDFTGTTPGKQKIDMTIDGVTASATVNVVSADYLREPVTYMGKTYNGIDLSTMSGSSKNVNMNSYYIDIKNISKLEVSYPTANTFSADAFFPLKLKVNNPDLFQFIRIVISDGTNTANYAYRGAGNDGEINTRIWLRWGAGSYTVKLYDLADISWAYRDYDSQKNTSEDGKIIYQGDNVLSYGGYWDSPAVTFTVTNTRDENGTWLYPSNVVQADDINIMNKSADLTFELETTYDKVKAVHDWIVLNYFYDNDSTKPEARKRQDAVAVMQYGMGVCEGYSNLTAAMLRNCGIETKYISSEILRHGWNHVNVGTPSKPDWRLLDCTWDDPDEDDAPNSVYYNNFLLADHNGGGHTDSGKANNGRSVSISHGHADGVESIAY